MHAGAGAAPAYATRAEPMDRAHLVSELKRLIVEELQLRGREPESIEDDAPLFGTGLGLDSLDALQLAMVVEARFQVKLPEGEVARPVFASVAALAGYVARARRP